MTKTNSPLLEQKRAAMKSRILDTAREIMREEGVAALSMQELARRLNIRAPSLYNYFTSKMDIYDFLFQIGYHKFASQIDRYLKEEDNWQSQLSNLMKNYMDFALQNPELYQLCFERPVPGFVPSETSLQISFEILERTYTHVKNWLPGLNTTLNERQLTDLLIAINHGITALHLANQAEIPLEESRFASLTPTVVSLIAQAWAK